MHSPEPQWNLLGPSHSIIRNSENKSICLYFRLLVPHSAVVSSDPSMQSLSPSHFHDPGMHGCPMAQRNRPLLSQSARMKGILNGTPFEGGLRRGATTAFFAPGVIRRQLRPHSNAKTLNNPFSFPFHSEGLPRDALTNRKSSRGPAQADVTITTEARGTERKMLGIQNKCERKRAPPNQRGRIAALAGGD